jgi:DNA-binding NtrC family response regulator
MRTARKWVHCIDDNEKTCSQIDSALSQLGYIVINSHNYADALAKAQNVKFDLYIINFGIREGTSENLYKQIRAIEVQAPVILTSDEALPQEILEMVNRDRNYFLALPFEQNEMRAIVSQLFNE